MVSTVEVLKTRLAAKNVVHVPEAAGLNKNGRDCVFIAMKYGTRATAGGVRRVKDADTGMNVDLNQLSIMQLRTAIAEHVKKVWDDANWWSHDAIKMHICTEARSYLRMPDARPDLVKDAYCKAVKGEANYPPLYGDLGVMLAFASKYHVVTLCFFPPRPTATVSTVNLFKPLKMGHNAPGNRSRVSCTFMMYILDEGVGHAEPLRGVTAAHVRQSRFNSTYHRQSVCAPQGGL